jgi:hypothetical protein
MMDDDDLYWHALNYRTAHTLQAQEMWVELVACVERMVARSREPFTDEQLLEILGDIDAETKRIPPGLKAFARAIERAHGIKGAE